MNLTRIYFTALAEALATSRPPRTTARGGVAFKQWSHDCQTLANLLESFNPAFNRAKFLSATLEGPQS